MKISYNWLNEYLPEKIEKQKLSSILTSIGLEVESLEYFENIKGSLKDLVVGEVVSCEQHPNADKLKLTKVDINKDALLQIVCGAPNVAVGQKVIVAPIGTTIYPFNNAPVTMKVAKIRSIESYGMICAEDEVGLSSNHSGIYILPVDAQPGNNVADYFNIYTDWIFEIGLTPNRMDAMSHIGVAKDVCAWLSYHNNNITKPKLPQANNIKVYNDENDFKVVIKNTNDCKRYSGLYIQNVSVKESPDWLRNYLTAIGQRPINNIVDITNFILHETGQPLHAFDADILTTKKIVIKNVPEGASFTTLDNVERKISNADLMICNDNEPVCIAGVFGGVGSGIISSTKNIFLESAWFSPSSIRKTSLRFGLRTEAAIRFEKGVDISGTVLALQRASLLIQEVAGGEVKGNLIDVYPSMIEKKKVILKYNYLKKLSGKAYEPTSIKNILTALDFDVLTETNEQLVVAAPLSKNDIALPADVVEEIVRIDGLDNIEISKSITITPSTQNDFLKEPFKEKITQILTGRGLNEVVINSIANSKIYSENKLTNVVRLLNNLSADLDILRPSMLETGLAALAYNINRKNDNLEFFEFGKTYQKHSTQYFENEYLCFWLTAKTDMNSWKQKINKPDFFTAKGIIENLFTQLNVPAHSFSDIEKDEDGIHQNIFSDSLKLGSIIKVNDQLLKKFDIKQEVFFSELNIENLLAVVSKQKTFFDEIPQYPAVERDLALIVDKKIKYIEIEKLIDQMSISYLQRFSLFDIFENDKIGNDKKSIAINFTFLNADKTLTDNEVDTLIKKIISSLEKKLNATIRNSK